ncbi:MAG: phosphate butyryltransferase [Odoribacteraceae bacterium]|jgi:phosphate butyryltransferase|nr:phosphate butyryltransferase [Odoribacteraceae bacterium]
MTINKIDDIYELLKNRACKKRLVVSYANDSHSIEAVHQAAKMGIIEATLCGDEEVIRRVCAEHGYDVSLFHLVHEPVDTKAAALAVQIIRDKKADFIMKGLVSTDKYMRAILNKESGLLPPKAILSHVTVMECVNYHKLLVVSDVAVIPVPDMAQKIAMVKYVTQTARTLGIERPKVALISATEQILPKVPSSVEAAVIAKMGERGQLGDIDIDGPYGLDVAIDAEAAAIKKVISPVAGNADCLVFPSLDAGNVFYKSNTKLANTRSGAILVGASAPSVLSSRGDSVDTKLNSIALAALLAK